MAEDMGRDRDLVLPPNTSAFVLDSTKGRVSVFVGPYKNSLSNTDQLVTWDSKRNRFTQVRDVDEAVSVFAIAGEGQYIVLLNPAVSGSADHPPKGTSSEAVDLEVGRKVNIAGPANFPLWPGQTSETIDGHHLRHNQYLMVRVYDEEQARQNWEQAVVSPQLAPAGSGEGLGEGAETTTPSTPTTDVTHELPTFTMGQLIVVKGTDVSFYMPPTGIEVVPEANGKFVREAVTLERLEYCILLDENGEKRYVRGPAVVFPSPTEKFVEGKDGFRKFRAIELNEHSGLYIKVIAEYTEDGVTHPVGEELFVTGAETAIYFPRPEHSIIEQGGKKVHYATAIPAGEGRYVLNRDRGTVDLVRGPKMFLPDPRTKVVVLRTLDDSTCQLLYPGNQEALEVNDTYRSMSNRLGAGERLAGGVALAAAASASVGESPLIASLHSASYEGDTFNRSTNYRPRTIVLDTKYDGAVSMHIWPGYAVLVTNKTGDRRVELGPKVVLLEYDETIMPLSLSTGKPKTTDRILRTAYLRVTNNQIGDIITVETRDLVSVELKVSYRVNFEGEDPLVWFDTENYVKVLTDHARSMLRNIAKQYGIQEFYTKTIDIVRNVLLGISADGERPGLNFPENGMRIYDVEILNVRIPDARVADLLVGAQTEAIVGAMEVSSAEERALRVARLEELKRISLDDTEKTAVKRTKVELATATRVLEQRMAATAAELNLTVENQKIEDQRLLGNRLRTTQELELRKEADAARMEILTLETSEYIRRMEAVDSTLVEALKAFGDQNFVEELVKAVGPAAMAAGVTTADIFDQLFKGTPFESALAALTTRPFAIRP